VRALARIMGEDPERTVRLPDRLPGPPRLPAGEAALAAAARSRSPEIRALEAELDAARKAARLRGRAGMPKVFAEASHTYEENPYLLHVNANVLFVGLSWNLYDGGARRARLAEARTGVSRVERLLADARRRVANRVDAAYRRYRQALREGRTAARNVAAAEENLRIEEDQYRVGMVTTTEVLDAEALLAASRFELIARHAGAYLRQGELLALAGEDLAAFYDHRAEGSVRSEDGS
jgi:Outer membrane protein